MLCHVFQIFGNQSRYQEQLDRMRNDYSDNNQQLQQKMWAHQRDHTSRYQMIPLTRPLDICHY